MDEIINENNLLKQRVNELEERLKKYTSGKITKNIMKKIRKRLWKMVPIIYIN